MKKIILISLLIVVKLSAFTLFGDEKNELAKLQYMQELKNLIVATQKTRGLTNNYMNGNTVAMLQVHAEISEMQKSIIALEKLSDVDNSVIVIKDDLLNLNKKALKIDSQQAFDTYTKLINKMLLIGSNFVTNNMKDSSKFSKEASSMMMNKILPFTENIGKIRGLGSGIVARTYSKPDEDIKMLSFVANVETLAKEEAPNMNILSQKYPEYFDSDISKEVDLISNDTQKYMDLTKNSVISKKDIKLNTNKYFNQGTGLISKALSLFEANANAIKKEIHN